MGTDEPGTTRDQHQFATQVELHTIAVHELAAPPRPDGSNHVSTAGVKSTDFGLSRRQRDLLFTNGVHAAKRFLNSWDFEAYLQRFRPARR